MKAASSQYGQVYRRHPSASYAGSLRRGLIGLERPYGRGQTDEGGQRPQRHDQLQLVHAVGGNAGEMAVCDDRDPG